MLEVDHNVSESSFLVHEKRFNPVFRFGTNFGRIIVHSKSMIENDAFKEAIEVLFFIKDRDLFTILISFQSIVVVGQSGLKTIVKSWIINLDIHKISSFFEFNVSCHIREVSFQH